MKTFVRSALLSLTLLFIIIFSNAQVRVSVRIAPPPLPVYVQPMRPTVGYLWEPGYWDYAADQEDYFWVPGVWVAPPSAGLYWTPGYWGYDGTVYVFNTGYWGPHVGYYGRVNYGFGYGGEGFHGGEWRDGEFHYAEVERTTATGRASFNGEGGVRGEPSRDEIAAGLEHHTEATKEQLNHRQNALADGSSFSKLNNGRPVAAAMDKVKGTTYNTHGAPSATTPAARVKALNNRNGQYALKVEGNNVARANDAAPDGAEKTDRPEKKEEEHADKKEERTEKKEMKEEQRSEKKEEQHKEKAQREIKTKTAAPKPVKVTTPSATHRP